MSSSGDMNFNQQFSDGHYQQAAERPRGRSLEEHHRAMRLNQATIDYSRNRRNTNNNGNESSGHSDNDDERP